MAGGISGVLNNPQLQNAINYRPQQPGQPQQPGEAQVYPPYFTTGLPPFDPNNPKGMPPPGGPMQGFNPARPDVGPRPFVAPYPLSPRPYPGQGNDMPIAPPYNPNAGIEQVRAQPQPQTQPMNPYGQRPERGVTPRNLAPMGTQGLRGLMNMNRR